MHQEPLEIYYQEEFRILEHEAGQVEVDQSHDRSEKNSTSIKYND